MADKIHVFEAIEEFKQYQDRGALNRMEFKMVMNELIDREGERVPGEYDKKTSDDTLNRIFGLFDANKNGIVDMDELAMMCTVIFTGSLVSLALLRS